MVADDALTLRAAKELLPQLEHGESPRTRRRGSICLSLDDDIGHARGDRRRRSRRFPAAVADYQSGKTAAIGRLIGETIKRTGGRANPDRFERCSLRH